MKPTATSVQIGRILITPRKCLVWLFGTLVLVCLIGIVLHQMRIRDLTAIPWTAGDWTLVSCLLLTIAATWFARELGERFEITFKRMWQRGVLISSDTGEPISHSKATETVEDIQAKASRSAIVGGITIGLIVALIVGIGETRKLSQTLSVFHLLWNFLGAAIYVFIGAVAGLIIGRSFVYAMLAQILRHEHIGIKVMPGHPDGAAGLKPVGDLFIRQAFLAMLPALFVGIWYFLILASPSDNEAWTSLRENYREPFQIAFFVFITLEILGFLLPMLRFHLEMKRQKTELQESADQLSKRITSLSRQVYETSKSQEEIMAIQSELDCLNKRHDEIELLPTWPVNWATWLKFAIGNLCLAIPVIVKLMVKLYVEFPDKTPP